jgi:hypothetical protein
MILRLLKGRGMVLGLFEKKRDAISPHPVPPQALQMGHDEWDTLKNYWSTVEHMCMPFLQ